MWFSSVFFQFFVIIFFLYSWFSIFTEKKQHNLYKIQEKYESILQELQSKTHDFDMEANLEQFLESQIHS